MNELLEFIIILVLLGTTFIVGDYIGWSGEKKEIQNEAINAGVAKYVLTNNCSDKGRVCLDNQFNQPIILWNIFTTSTGNQNVVLMIIIFSMTRESL